MLINRDRTKLTRIRTAVCQTATTMLSDFISANRTLIAGDLHDFNDIVIVRIAAHCHLDLFTHDRAFLEYAATHRWLLARNNLHWNIQNSFEQCAIPCHTRNLAQHFITKILGSGVKFSHILCREYSLLLLILCHILKHI